MFHAHVWHAHGGVSKRRSFARLGDAQNFAQKQLQQKPGIRHGRVTQVTITETPGELMPKADEDGFRNWGERVEIIRRERVAS